MKRFLAVLSAVLIPVFCLAACSSKDDNVSTQTDDLVKTANINNAADIESTSANNNLPAEKTTIVEENDATEESTITAENDAVEGTNNTDENDAAKESTAAQGEKMTVTLYFGDDQAEYVVGEQRDINIQDGSDSLYKRVFLELMKGPETEGLQNSIPKGTELLSINVDNGICTVDLSSEFVDNSPGGTASERMTLWSVVNTLTGLKGIDKVQFLIEGEKRQVYTHAVFDELFERDESLISK